MKKKNKNLIYIPDPDGKTISKGIIFSMNGECDNQKAFEQKLRFRRR